MRRIFAPLKQVALVALVSLALVASGLAHRAPASEAAQSLSPQLLSYVMAGGDLADLCAETGKDGLVHQDPCPACQIAQSLLPPPVTGFARDADLVFLARVIAPRESRAARAVLDIANGLRAPPQA